MKNSKLHGLRLKFILWFSLLAVAMITVLCSFYYYTIRDNIFELYGDRVERAVELAAGKIDGDTALKYLAQGYIGEEFQNADEGLKEIKKVFGLKYLYLVKPQAENIQYIYAAYNEGDDIYSKVTVGQEDAYIGDNRMMLDIVTSGVRTNRLESSYDEKYGYLASAYAPIFDAKGKAILVMAADFEIQPVLDKIKYNVIRVGIGVFFVVIVLIFLYAIFLDKRVVFPLKELTQHSKTIVAKCRQGTLTDYQENFGALKHRDDEIYELARSFYQMTIDLQTYISNLEKVTNEKQKIEAELNVAKSIQLMLLPKIFPPFKVTDDFSIYASIEPAKSVGGDYYDFYMIDEDHICFTIADVSGKGVPAALFMVIAKTIMKNQAMSNYEPDHVLYETNNQLCADNEEGMFVTAFFAVYEISTGRLTYANAGHNPPLLYRYGGRFEYLPMKKGVVLAVMDGMEYYKNEIFLGSGDILFSYTDGVTEAMNQDGELYSEERLFNVLNQMMDKSSSLEKIQKQVRSSVAEHVQEAEQSDDITMLIFGKY